MAADVDNKGVLFPFTTGHGNQQAGFVTPLDSQMGDPAGVELVIESGVMLWWAPDWRKDGHESWVARLTLFRETAHDEYSNGWGQHSTVPQTCRVAINNCDMADESA